MTRLLLVPVALGTLLGCASLEGMDPDQPCLEAGYAIASRTFDCEDDGELANARYERFAEELACIPHPLEEEDGAKLNPQVDLFHCAYTIRTLGCGDADRFGDDLAAWMSVSPACNLVATFADGTPLPPFDGFEPFDTGLLDEPECTNTPAGEAVRFRIQNIGSEELFLNWLNPANCTETVYATLRPLEDFTQPTYAGHVWVVRDVDGELVTWFTAEPGMGLVVVP
jgi:hypothetical protein